MEPTNRLRPYGVKHLVMSEKPVGELFKDLDAILAEVFGDEWGELIIRWGGNVDVLSDPSAPTMRYWLLYPNGAAALTSKLTEHTGLAQVVVTEYSISPA
jgi:hypothetical protein